MSGDQGSKTKRITINLNEYVKVKLTDYGKDVFYHQFDDVIHVVKHKGGKPPEPSMPSVDAEEYTSFQLWYLMQLFGPHIGIAMPQPFDINIVYELPEGF